MYRVKDVMTEEVVSCKATDTLESAVRIMRDCGCGCVPVVDEKGRVVGLVTDRDALLCALDRGKSLKDLQVADACTRRVICCEVEDTLHRAEALMRTNRVRRLPVLGPDRALIGVVSLTDLARHVELQASESGTGLSPRHIAIVLAETSGVRTMPPPRGPERSGPKPITEPFFHG